MWIFSTTTGPIRKRRVEAALKVQGQLPAPEAVPGRLQGVPAGPPQGVEDGLGGRLLGAERELRGLLLAAQASPEIDFVACADRQVEIVVGEAVADKKVMEKYGAWGEKMMYGKKKIGVIRSTVWVGPNGKVKKHWAKVPKAADHPAKVWEALEADD